MTAWIPILDFTYTHIIPASLVGCATERSMVSTAPAREVGISLSTAPAGRASLCFKHHQAQTDRHLAPGCEDELSGLDPANTSCLQLHEGHTETKGYSGGIGLCQLAVKPTIKTPIGSDMLPDLQSISCAKEPRRTGSHARSSPRLAVGIAIGTGGNDGYS
jgi:hypothetical protein